MPPRDYYLPQRRLVSQEDAATIERANIPRSRFRGTWSRKMPFDAGWLYPFLIEEVLPGDHLKYRVTALVRMATPLFPLLDSQRIDTFFFFVPNRILWTNWVRFMGEQTNPSDSIAYTIPQIVSPASGFAVGSIYDYMGLPTVGQIGGGNTISINALPLRAYWQVVHYWFRDENLVVQSAGPTGDGPDVSTSFALRRRAKSHDYFTSALPWPQKFTPPGIPLSGLAPIIGLGYSNAAVDIAGPATFRESSGNTLAGGGTTRSWGRYMQANTAGANNTIYAQSSEVNIGYPAVFADLAQATAVSVNTFRTAFLTQQLLERDARGGTRYVELIRSHFGVVSPDFRLQRPEYIGGGQTPLQVTPVAQTAPSTGVTVGALGAAGAAAGQHAASYAATEHGYIIGIINVRTELSYQQGIPRMFSRSTRYDFYFPALAGLGEQSILRKEIYATGNSTDDNTVFGYQERWHEYRTRYSEVCGVFRSTAAGTIDGWHFAQRFTAPPLLNETFINDVPPMSRVLAAGATADGQQYLADLLIERDAVRPIPTYGTPVLLGRF